MINCGVAGGGRCDGPVGGNQSRKEGFERVEPPLAEIVRGRRTLVGQRSRREQMGDVVAGKRDGAFPEDVLLRV